MKNFPPLLFASSLLPAVVALWVAVAAGQNNTAPELSPQDLANQLASPQQTDITAALAVIAQRLLDDPAATAAQVRGLWLKSLLAADRNTEALDLCAQTIVAVPFDTGNVALLQRQRVDIFIRLHRVNDALSEAKAYFNICPMAGTDQALLLLAERLNAARGNESGAVEQLVIEQRRGVTSTEAAPVASPTVRSIKVASAIFQAAIRKLHLPSGDLPVAGQDLIALGNLLLLADQPEESLKVFTRMRETVGVEQLRAANDGVARSMRAVDGTVGRANAFATSIAR